MRRFKDGGSHGCRRQWPELGRWCWQTQTSLFNLQHAAQILHRGWDPKVVNQSCFVRGELTTQRPLAECSVRLAQRMKKEGGKLGVILVFYGDMKATKAADGTIDS